MCYLCTCAGPSPVSFQNQQIHRGYNTHCSPFSHSSFLPLWLSPGGDRQATKRNISLTKTTYSSKFEHGWNLLLQRQLTQLSVFGHFYATKCCVLHLKVQPWASSCDLIYAEKSDLHNTHTHLLVQHLYGSLAPQASASRSGREQRHASCTHAHTHTQRPYAPFCSESCPVSRSVERHNPWMNACQRSSLSHDLCVSELDHLYYHDKCPQKLLGWGRG